MDDTNFLYDPSFVENGCELTFDTGYAVSGDRVIISSTSGYPLVGEELYCGCGEVSTYAFQPVNDGRSCRTECIHTHSPTPSKLSGGSLRSTFSQDSLVTGENGSRCEAAEQPSLDESFFESEAREWVVGFEQPMGDFCKSRPVEKESIRRTSNQGKSGGAFEVSKTDEKSGPSPMAFTVDLGGGGLQIGDSISKFIPKHRRNLSSSRASPDAMKAYVDQHESPKKNSPESKAGRNRLPGIQPDSPSAVPKLKSPASFLLQRMFDIPGESGEKLADEFVMVEDGVMEMDIRDDGSETGTYTIDNDKEDEDDLDDDECGEALADNDMDDTCSDQDDQKVWDCRDFPKPGRMVAMPQVKLDHMSSAVPQVPSSVGRGTPPFKEYRHELPMDSRSSSSSSSPSKLSWSLESQNKPRRKLPAVPAGVEEASEAMSNINLDTERFLRDTETVVAAMQERVTRAQKAAAPPPPQPPRTKHKTDHHRLTVSPRAASLSRDGSSSYDRAKAESPRDKSVSESTGSVRSEISSVGSSGEASEVGIDNGGGASPSIRKNRAFSSLRRGRLDSEPEPPLRTTPPVQPARSKTAALRSTPTGKTALKQSLSSVGSSSKISADSDAFARNDGGRHSLKLSRGSPAPQAATKPKRAPVPGSVAKKPPLQNPVNRSANLIAGVNRDEEYANWQRRKGYNPRKAAAEGKINKNVPARVTRESPKNAMTQSAHEAVKPFVAAEAVPPKEHEQLPYAVLKSASFHGSEGIADSQRRRRGKPVTQAPTLATDDVLELSSPDSQSSPQRRPDEDRYSAPRHRFEPDASHPVSLPEPVSGGWSGHQVAMVVPVQLGSPRAVQSPKSPFRSATQPGKLETLDSLVLSSVFSLSSRLNDRAKKVLEKLKCQVSDETDVAGKLEDLILVMDSAEASSPVGNASKPRSSSKDLSGTLKNLRRLEQVMTLVDEVLSMDPTTDDYERRLEVSGDYDDDETAHAAYNGYHGAYLP
ncbi:unnamed protein product [Notodromas monacha]|uniref:Uncharacterized protein n=1 Tax=Notodromas monacha TaxID=399045 RepID=A0A7R9GAI5_9CRUS|nr:unnamed protein product [Notodromas monacha]CAG0915385.1 unnamed protein product [Notodromas monacha]